MRKHIYPRLAAQSCRKNGKFYFPYLLTVIGCAAALYIILALGYSTSLPGMLRYEHLRQFLGLGAVVLRLFTLIFLFYTNSFLMKRRSKELGLYNVLGMGKWNIAAVLSFESLYTWALGVGAGLAAGLLLQKLAILLVQKVTQIDQVFAFYISGKAILQTAVWFGTVLLLTLVKNLWRLRKQNPTELLRGGSVGEREPKTRWLLVILGLLTLGAGYYLATVTKNPMDAMAIYFVAVILVIIGTYCLFVAVSILILKALRKNKGFYYRTRNFIGLSGMLHRMNRNGVGLANICILSTMVLVMISTTLSLYVGIEDALRYQCPYQFVSNILITPDQTPDLAQIKSAFTDYTEEQGLGVTQSAAYATVDLYMDEAEAGSLRDTRDGGTCAVVLLTAEGYSDLIGQPVTLEPGTLLTSAEAAPDGTLTFCFLPEGGETPRELRYAAAPLPKEITLSRYDSYELPRVYVVLPDWTALQELVKNDAWVSGDARLATVRCGIDTDGDSARQLAFLEEISNPENMAERLGLSWESYFMQAREPDRENFYAVNGAFFFLGVLLGLIFLMAIVLIVYYKQISEGYEDRARFQIMQQVGLEKRDIRRSINAQVLFIFFAPLVVAGIHVIFDFNLVQLLMTLFGMVNKRLAALCTLGTFAAFALLYGAVYRLTARTYYRIISEK